MSTDNGGLDLLQHINEAIADRGPLPEQFTYFPDEYADRMAVQLRDAIVRGDVGRNSHALQKRIVDRLPNIGVTPEREHLYWRVLRLDAALLIATKLEAR